MSDPSSVTLQDALTRRRSIRSFGPSEIPLAALERVLWAGQGSTGPDDERTAPSAHGVHPLSLIVTVGRVGGLRPGTLAVEPGGTTLTALDVPDVRQPLERAALDAQPWVGEAAAVITVCADVDLMAAEFADQDPTGRRGARYVDMEVGAAVQNMLLQATAEGLGAVFVAGIDVDATREVLAHVTTDTPVAHVCLGVPST